MSLLLPFATSAEPGTAAPGLFLPGTLIPAVGPPLPAASYSGNLVIYDVDSTVSVVADSMGAGVVVINALGSGIEEPTVQLVDITLNEFNDVSINLAITQSGIAFNLTGYTVQMLLKTAAGTPDSQALTLSSAGSNPAITITNASGGLATVAIPHTDLQSEQYMFYRVDVVNSSGDITTCAYGPIAWISL